MYTILGAGGSIANELAAVLFKNIKPFKLVSRNPKPLPGGVVHPANITDAHQADEAVKGSSVVVLCAGLKYNIKVWKEQWPRIMQNTIEACKKNDAKLIFFDNIYALGKVEGAMTEETTYNPNSKKGEIRLQIANQLTDAVKQGLLTGMIARSADFYGPNCKTSFLNALVFDKLAAGKKPQWLVNDQVKHSFTYTSDCGKALYLLGENPNAFNQTWHLPTAHPALTGKELIALAAAAFGKSDKHTILGKGMIRFGGLFSGLLRELPEMLYQNEFDYVFDSSKFEKAFGISPTSYEEGIKITAGSYKPGINKQS